MRRTSGVPVEARFGFPGAAPPRARAQRKVHDDPRASARREAQARGARGRRPPCRAGFRAVAHERGVGRGGRRRGAHRRGVPARLDARRPVEPRPLRERDRDRSSLLEGARLDAARAHRACAARRRVRPAIDRGRQHRGARAGGLRRGHAHGVRPRERSPPHLLARRARRPGPPSARRDDGRDRLGAPPRAALARRGSSRVVVHRHGGGRARRRPLRRRVRHAQHEGRSLRARGRDDRPRPRRASRTAGTANGGRRRRDPSPLSRWANASSS